MPFDLIIRNGQLVRESVERGDVAVENEKIVEIAPTISGPAREEIDATNLHVFPGVIDPHVHFNEPGRTDWEGFETGSAALSAGGGTMFFDMPLNSSPPVLDGKSFDLKLAAGLKNSRTDFALWGGLTPDNLDKMEELAERGVVGFKAFMSNSGIEDFRAADDFTLYRGMETAAKLGLIVAVHAENDVLTSRLAEEARRDNRTSWRDYVQSRPIVAELEAIGRAIEFARATRCKLHIVHVSSAAGAQLVDSSTDYGLCDVTCETCPHYLLLNEDDLEKLGARGKCAPPLRPLREVEKLVREMGSPGVVEFVASDHSPAPESLKSSGDYFAAWGGIPGVQSTLTALCSRFTIEPEAIAEMTSGAVAWRFGIGAKGRIQPGVDADFALVDVNAKKPLLTRGDLLDRHKLSPYVGRLPGRMIRRTILRGHTIFADGKTVGPPIGRFVRPSRAGAAS